MKESDKTWRSNISRIPDAHSPTLPSKSSAIFEPNLKTEASDGIQTFRINTNTKRKKAGRPEKKNDYLTLSNKSK